MKKILSILMCVVILALTFVGCSNKEVETTTEPTTTTTTTKAPVVNPFTGESGYSEKAVNKRPVSIVVENAPAARPQWGITSPDIIVEGEVEGGITRMLWIYADVNDVPEKVGPTRSARPSFVKMASLFDAYYIHWGGSHSKGSYVGGYETIKKLGVDDMDGMKGGVLFGRDTSRSVSSEHRGIVYGKKINEVIKKKGYRTKKDSKATPTFTFNNKPQDVGTDKADDKVKVTFSSRTNTRTFTYNAEKNKYVTNDWDTKVSFKNIIVLMDKTTYITKSNYKGSGRSETYLNYTLGESGGEGYLISNGTKTKIKWTAGSTLKITDENGKSINFNKGDSYIALASSNNGGKVSITAKQAA